ncbi:unnamed protein product, partial [Polarella glacialis]
SVPLPIGAEVGFPYSCSGELTLFLRFRLLAAALPDAALAAAACAQTAVLDFRDLSTASSASSQVRTQSRAAWMLRVSFVEGLSVEELAALPLFAREFQVDDASQLVI